MGKNPPNIIIIVMDTCSAKHMSIYGYHRRTTPKLERLAENRGTVYTRCYAPSAWTIPCHASLFTGLYPSEHRVDGVKPEDLILNQNIQHLVNVLKQSGYRTYGISCNALVSEYTGLCSFFDEFYELFHPGLMYPQDTANQHYYLQKLLRYFKHVINYRKYDILFDAFKSLLKSHKLNIASYFDSADITRRSFDEAGQIIGSHMPPSSDKPIFMFVNIIENHSFYYPPRPIAPSPARKTGRWLPPIDYIGKNFPSRGRSCARPASTFMMIRCYS